jgi:hypothetical protein
MSELKAQQESPTHRAENRNLWTTRAENAPLWTACGTPRFRNTPDNGKSYFPHILLRRGHSRAQPVRAAETAVDRRQGGMTRDHLRWRFAIHSQTPMAI